MMGRREVVMHRFMLLVGMGFSLLAAPGCRARPDTPLTAAAAANDPDAVRRLLADGHTPDEGGDNWTALMWAARENAIGAMTALVDGGADVNRRDRYNRWTPLLHAIHRQHPNAVALLLDRGADANAATPEGVTPLMMAADDPRPTMVELLLQHGADPRAKGPGGITALTQAVSGGALSDVTDRPLLGGCRPETVRALFAHDAMLKIPDSFAGRHAIWWARFHGCEEVLKMVGFQQAGAAHQAVAGVGLLRDAVGARKLETTVETITTRDPKPTDDR
jgi:hypothetical protein